MGIESTFACNSLQAIAPSPRPTSGMSLDDQSKLFRFTLKHSVKLACVVGALAVVYV